MTLKEYIEVLSSNKGQLKGKCFDSIAMEYFIYIKNLRNDKLR